MPRRGWPPAAGRPATRVMLTSLAHRTLEREIMDDHVPPQEVVDEVYRFLGGINKWLGGVRATLRHFERFSHGWEPGQRLRVLDVACGGGDMGRALVAWARRRGVHLEVVGLDISRSALSVAQRRGDLSRLRFVTGDVHRSPFRDGTFDYVVCALFFHHLSDEEVVRTIQLFARLSSRGIVINDLVRGWRHLFWSWLFTRPFNPILRHDGPLSVRRAFCPRELVALARRSGVEWLSVERHAGHRMTLAGERQRRHRVGYPSS